MENNKKKKLVLAFALAMMVSVSFAYHSADSCIVWYGSSQEIKIGGRPIKVGLRIDEKDPVAWHSDDDYFKVVYYQSSIPTPFYAKDFNKVKANSILEYLTSKNMSTKGSSNPEETDTPIVFDTVFFLWDTLRIPKPNNYGSHVINDVVVYSATDTIASRISVSTDGKDFLIPRKAFGMLASTEPLYIDIIETDIDKNWQYAVWRKLYVVPLKIE